MLVTVNNLGAISRAEIDMSRRLTIMCGPNSTGKTYLSYVLYTIFSNRYRIVTDKYAEIASDIEKSGQFTIKKEILNQFLQLEADEVKDSMRLIFGLSPDQRPGFFKFFKLKLEFTDTDYQKLIESKIKFALKWGDKTFKVEKVGNSDIVKCDFSFTDVNHPFSKIPLWDFVVYTILKNCAHASIQNARMLTVERNSIYTFSKELSLSRFELINNIFDAKDSEKDPHIFELINTESQRYPLAIRDSLRIANDLENIQKQKGDFFDFAVKIEKEMLHGTIGITKTGSVDFLPLTTPSNKKRLPINITSSIVKTMSSLIIYLKHIAKKNDLLIIDEPEINLHPDNQILLARIFAMLANHGLRLIVSTHSDYIIREFNNLVMARELFGRDRKSDIKMPYIKEETLDYKELQVLYFKPEKNKKNKVESLPVDKYGFSVESIDKAINTQNEITEELYDLLKYGADD